MATRVAATLRLVTLATLCGFAGEAVPPDAATARAPDPHARLGPRDPDSAETCGQCHVDFYQEWKGRAHQLAWDDPIYQEALKTRKRPEVCWGCHIPVDVHQRLGRKPKPREDLRSEGVTCVTCHKAKASGDTILGPFGAATDAHDSAKNPAFGGAGSNHLCASCHGTKILPVLPVARDHKRYVDALGDDAKSCVECHMPQVERHLAVSMVTGKPVGDERTTRSHAVRGPGDVEFCASAFELGGSRDGDDLVVTLGNQAGHRIPGLTLRTFRVTVIQRGSDGQEVASEEIVLSHENPVQALETREFRTAAAEGVVKMTLRVDHLFEDEVVATLLTADVDL